MTDSETVFSTVDAVTGIDIDNEGLRVKKCVRNRGFSRIDL